MTILERVVIGALNSDIPTELMLRILKKESRYGDMLTIEEMVMQNIVYKLFLPELNVLSQEMVNVPLDICTLIYSDLQTSVFRIPPNNRYTGDRDILNVSSLTPTANTYSQGFNNGNTSIIGAKPYETYSPLISMANQALDAVTNDNNVSIHTQIQMLGNRVFSVNVNSTMLMGFTARVNVGNDAALSNINLKKLMELTELLRLRIKAYIYQKGLIYVNKGEVIGGMEINSFKELIDEYKTAYDDYQEKLKAWKKHAFTNNRVNYNRLLSLNIPK